MAIRLTLVCHAPLARMGEIGFPTDEHPVEPMVLAEAAGIVGSIGRFDRLKTAPERRARETAAVFGNDAMIISELRDCHYGNWRGRALIEIGENDPQGTSEWISDPGAAPHGGETILALLHRIGTWLDLDPVHGHTIAVTHPAVIRAAIVHTLNASPNAFWCMDIEPLSMTDLRYNNGRWTLRSMGRTRARDMQSP